ncbi:N-acetylglucosamine kinase [Pantoea ananatis]|uniref:BadF/BadG/BcrA/BcrD ATPase family protein n=1 Tax=Pantoea ananas TaxID=553 RepID=UPI0007371BDD|nr:BadF/BadG/BcrA/BcrD ATPase family protein [Pantoea ananatis]KTR47064.1 N-acetylglucosamine kinase [Pantoea ananatis]KTR57109.1 N-acetylglucosamine kinase [Pantoea ananatis]KTR62896.1 N-acetylglucosamine kinase [Pantoea ananatis]KTR71676.1 N-acetylglucosamine kinase [Pantoea ananatis]MCW0348820.1 Glucosamine kinase GspK [Pantoea ananatis]
MQSHYLLGIDGGGTQCRARLTDANGNVLAQAVGGPANVWSQFDAALNCVEQLMAAVLSQAGLTPQALAQTSLVAGLAGANVASVKARLTQWQPACATVQVVSDVEIACAGAHAAAPGAVFIIGTGSQGAAWDGERFTLLGGWGFALSDHGSGAELGRRALRLALLAHEAIVDSTDFTHGLMAQFSHSPETMLMWTREAMPADWARVVPDVFAAAHADDRHAVALLQQTASDIGLMVSRLSTISQGCVALMGGLATPIQPWLSAESQARLVAAQHDALDGALMMARANLRTL